MFQIPHKTKLEKALAALVVTCATAALFHLALVGVASIIKHDMSYLNPLDFLGISILFPDYRDSSTAAMVGWLVLIVLFFTVMYLQVHYRFYIAILRDTLTNGVSRASKTLRKASDKVLQTDRSKS